LRLASAHEALAELGAQGRDKPGADAWQASNLHLVASAIVTAALAREETRGSHWRDDFPRARDAWLGHLVLSLDQDGLHPVFEPVMHG
jgi:L-aspartate oxidase